MNIFDIIGPVMIGPSSSHTAGAVRIGLVARLLMQKDVKKAKIILHGSFAKTAVGHGTDRAIIGGLLGFGTDDIRIKDSFDYAKQQGLDFSFETKELDGVHPNTALIEMQNSYGQNHTVQACSIGGGKIEITQIDGLEVSFNGNLNTTILFQEDKFGIIAAVSGKFAQRDINIANMKVFRVSKNTSAIMVIETDYAIDDSLLDDIRNTEHVNNVIFVPKM